MSLSRCAFVVIVLVTLIVGVGVGVLIGYFARPQSAQESLMEKLTADANPSIQQKLMDAIDANNIRDYLKYAYQISTLQHAFAKFLNV